MAGDPTRELEATLWKAANKLRGSLPASQYKDVILGLVFLEYASEQQWKYLSDNAKSPMIGRLVDRAIDAVGAADPALSDMIPKLYRDVDGLRLGALIELLDGAQLRQRGERARDLM